MNTNESARGTLWARIQILMQERWGGENQNRLAREAGVGVATIARMKQSETSVGLDVVEKVAHAFGVEAWQLICPLEVLEGSHELSPLALDLARSLDSIQDEDQHRRAYAVAAQVLSFGSTSYGREVQASEIQPSPAPHQEK